MSRNEFLKIHIIVKFSKFGVVPFIFVPAFHQLVL